MKKLLAILIVILSVTSAFAADLAVGNWTTISEPCFYELSIHEDGTFSSWKACVEPKEGCYKVAEVSGAWTKVSPDMVALKTGAKSDLLLLQDGTTAIHPQGLKLCKHDCMGNLRTKVASSKCEGEFSTRFFAKQ